MKPTITLLRSVAIVCLLFTHFSCTTGSNSPTQAARLFFTAFQEKDFSKAKKYATHQSSSMLEIMSSLGEKAELPAKQEEKQDFSLKTLVETESAATVQVVLPDNRRAIIMQLEKENGAWKVAFDKSLD